MHQIIYQENLAPQINVIKLKIPHIVKKAQPGQFVILRIGEKGERIPMSIADLDKNDGILTIVFQEVGKTTVQLGMLRKGDSLVDVVGPLGIPTHIEKLGNCVCVGGGIGIAPIHPIARALKDAGNQVTSIIGARNKNLLIMEEQMKKASHKLLVSTDDGSYGRRGFVTDILTELLVGKEKIDFVMAIGPVIMMKAVCNVTKPYNVRTMVSLNPIMVDGTGMCGACRVTVGGITKFACVDGPDFDGHQVDFDELVKRQSMYVKQEKISVENFKQAKRG